MPDTHDLENGPDTHDLENGPTPRLGYETVPEGDHDPDLSLARSGFAK